MSVVTFQVRPAFADAFIEAWAGYIPVIYPVGQALMHCRPSQATQAWSTGSI